MTRGERIRMAMQVARIKQPQLAKLIGTSQVYVSRIVNDHDPADARLPKIAEVLSVPFEWLAVGGNPPEWASPMRAVESTEARDGSLLLPLIGQVTAGDGWANPSQDPDDSAPVVIKGRWRAVRIEGSSAEPIVLPGQCVLVDDQLKPKHGRLVCVQTNDGRAYCKRFCDVGEGHIVLAGLNAGQDSIALRRDDIARISVVVGTLYTDSVAK